VDLFSQERWPFIGQRGKGSGVQTWAQN
jgi:hypothetical protein